MVVNPYSQAHQRSGMSPWSGNCRYVWSGGKWVFQCLPIGAAPPPSPAANPIVSRRPPSTAALKCGWQDHPHAPGVQWQCCGGPTGELGVWQSLCSVSYGVRWKPTGATPTPTAMANPSPGRLPRNIVTRSLANPNLCLVEEGGRQFWTYCA